MYNDAGEAVKVLPILMFCFVAIASTYIFGTLLTANNNLKQLNVLALVGLCLNIILNYILIPQYQAYGSAIASLITQALIVLVQVIIVKKVFKFPFNFKFILSIIVIVGVLFLVNNYIQFSVFYRTIIIGGLGLFLSLILKVVNVKDVKKLLLNRK